MPKPIADSTLPEIPPATQITPPRMETTHEVAITPAAITIDPTMMVPTAVQAARLLPWP